MSAKRARRWGVHFRVNKSNPFMEIFFRTRSSFTVRGRTRYEAEQNALKHPEMPRGEMFIVMPIVDRRRGR